LVERGEQLAPLARSQRRRSAFELPHEALGQSLADLCGEAFGLLARRSRQVLPQSIEIGDESFCEQRRAPGT
jgi:hypothetical protein